METIDGDRYPLSPRILTLKAILAKIRPEPAQNLLTWMFAGLLIGGAWAQSQRPSPTPGVKSQPPHTQAAQTNKNPDANQRGTETRRCLHRHSPDSRVVERDFPSHRGAPPFIEGWYNPARLHSALGYRSPMAYEHAIEVQPTEA